MNEEIEYLTAIRFRSLHERNSPFVAWSVRVGSGLQQSANDLVM